MRKQMIAMLLLLSTTITITSMHLPTFKACVDAALCCGTLHILLENEKIDNFAKTNVQEYPWLKKHTASVDPLAPLSTYFAAKALTGLAGNNYNNFATDIGTAHECLQARKIAVATTIASHVFTDPT